MSDEGRIEFLPRTKREIAKAVGWKCSAPLCKNPAVGMIDDGEINGGTVCHIYSAAKNGPRGRGDLTDEQLADRSNGLWCCAFHGRVIDANKGRDFPASQLRMWKRLAEGRVKRAMAVEFTELGWIHKIELSVGVRDGQVWRVTMELQKNNLLCGGEAAGKSLLLEALASISSSRHAWRIRQFDSYAARLSYETLTRESVAEVSCMRDRLIERKQSGALTALSPPDVMVIYLAPARRWPDGQRDVDKLQDLLGVDIDVLQGLVRAISDNADYGLQVELRRAYLAQKDDSKEGVPLVDVEVKLRATVGWLPFGGISSSEQLLVARALMVELARQEAKSRPVLLCIDSMWSLDDKVFRNVLQKLADEALQIIAVPGYDFDEANAGSEFSAWKVQDIPSIQEYLQRNSDWAQ